jgi:hypothetical protein
MRRPELARLRFLRRKLDALAGLVNCLPGSENFVPRVFRTRGRAYSHESISPNTADHGLETGNPCYMKRGETFRGTRRPTLHGKE